MSKKYYVNLEMFSNPDKMTKESVYILGLMWADGNIYSGNSTHRTTVTGVSDDFEALSEIFNKTGSWAKYVRAAKGNRRQQTTYYIGNKLFYDFLYSCDYKFKSKNSAVKILKIIPNELQRYWWLGFFDGDGCIYHKVNSQLFFTGSIDQDWSFFELIPLDIHWKSISKRTKNGNYSRMIIQDKKSIKLFCEYIYASKDVDNIGFDRKYIKFKNLIKLKERKTIGLGGVYFNKTLKKWIARPIYNKVAYALGCFSEKEDAINAVLQKRQEWTNEFNKLNN